jgi:hypothetical protein
VSVLVGQPEPATTSPPFVAKPILDLSVIHFTSLCWFIAGLLLWQMPQCQLDLSALSVAALFLVTHLLVCRFEATIV